MNKLCVTLGLLLVGGCACVDLTQPERNRIAALHDTGIAWSTERSRSEFVPPITMEAAICWGLLPGAGQIFIADKIADAGLEENFDVDCIQLKSSGTLMLLVSWIPYVHSATLPFGMGGIVQDVNRVNNYALLKHREAGDLKGASSPKTQSVDVAPAKVMKEVKNVNTTKTDVKPPDRKLEGKEELPKTEPQNGKTPAEKVTLESKPDTVQPKRDSMELDLQLSF